MRKTFICVPLAVLTMGMFVYPLAFISAGVQHFFGDIYGYRVIAAFLSLIYTGCWALFSAFIWSAVLNEIKGKDPQ